MDMLVFMVLTLNPTSTYNMINAFIADEHGLVGLCLLFAHAHHLSDLFRGGGVSIIVMETTMIVMVEPVMC